MDRRDVVSEFLTLGVNLLSVASDSFGKDGVIRTVCFATFPVGVLLIYYSTVYRYSKLRSDNINGHVLKCE